MAYECKSSLCSTLNMQNLKKLICEMELLGSDVKTGQKKNYQNSMNSKDPWLY